MSLSSIATSILLAVCVMIPQVASAESSAEILARRKAMAADKPYTSVVPRSNEPEGRMIVLRIWPDEPGVRFALASLQGIVNREKPKLWIGLDKIWGWTEYHSGKVTTKVEIKVDKVFEMFKDKVKGMVIYDRSLPELCNIAITYAGIEDLIPVTPELAEEYSAKFGWKVVHDLRGRWKTRLEAYTWSYENLFPRCTKFALMHYTFNFHPTPEEFELEGPGHLVAASVDYAVENRMFVWHLANRPDPGDMALAIKIMESVPLYTPVVGASHGDMYDEPAWVGFVATYANLHIPLYSSNVSVLSGVRIPEDQLRQKKYPIRDSGPDKVYVAYTNSEHDNMGHVIGGGPPWERIGMETDDPYRIFWCDPWRGRVPMGWPIGPLLCELAPTILARMVTTQTENDLLMAALSGICLTDIPSFGSAYPKQQDELLAGYSKLSGEYMKRLGWTTVNPWGPPGNLRTFMKNIPELEGVFEGYGSRMAGSYERANYLLGGVPVFHALTGGVAGEGRTEPIAVSYARRAKVLVDQINAVKVKERPAFIHAWTIGWDYCPTILKMVTDQLPKDYVVVRPDELAALYKKYKGKGAELQSGTPNPKPRGVVTDTANGEDGLIVDTGKMKVEIPWGAKVNPPIKRVMGVDGVWRCGGNLYEYNPSKLTVANATYERVRNTSTEKSYLLTYTYSNGVWIKLRMKAVAGHPYVLIDEEYGGGDAPSWGFNVYTDFKPDRRYTDLGDEQIVYGGSEANGSMPWASWILFGKTDCRDIIGFYTVSWGDWNNGDIVFWQHPTNAYLEVYRQRAGVKRFAVAVLDKNEPDAQKRVWKELNGK